MFIVRLIKLFSRVSAVIFFCFFSDDSPPSFFFYAAAAYAAASYSAAFLAYRTSGEGSGFLIYLLNSKMSSSILGIGYLSAILTGRVIGAGKKVC
jgi:hypothetical protein